MKRILGLALLALVLAPLSVGCSGLVLRAEAAADGKITAGPVVIAGLTVAPKFDVVDGIATVVVSSTPPFLQINLDPRATFAARLDEAQASAIAEGRVVIYRMGAKVSAAGYPVTSRAAGAGAGACGAPSAPTAAAGPCAPAAAAPVCEAPKAPPPPPNPCAVAAAAPSKCGQPVYVAPKCLPKFPPGTFDGLNESICSATKAMRAWLSSVLPTEK